LGSFSSSYLQKNTNAPAQRVDAILFDQPTKHLTSLVHSTGSNAQILHYVCQKDPEFIYWRKMLMKLTPGEINEAA